MVDQALGARLGLRLVLVGIDGSLCGIETVY